jgi:phosphatidylglycerophosphate synthase
MIKSLTIALPSFLTVIRLLAGPVYLAWGTVPAGTAILVALALAAATDLVDGWLARTTMTTTSFGAALDATADKIFVLCLMLKLSLTGVLAAWAFAIVLVEYIALAIAGSILALRFKKVPIPGTAARLAAIIAVMAVLTGVGLADQVLTAMLALTLIIVNISHLVVAWRRVIGLLG